MNDYSNLGAAVRPAPPSRALLPYLLGTANNLIYKRTRTLMRHHRALAKLPRGLEPDLADSAVDRIDAEVAMQAVLRSVRTLSRVEQEAIALCIWSGLTYADAALAMGVPIGTVRSRLARAREHLRALHTDQTSGQRSPLAIEETS